MDKKRTVFVDPPYAAVMFTMGDNECLGFIYTYLLEEFNKPETEPQKRFFMCNTVINNRTRTIMKNSYEGRTM